MKIIIHGSGGSEGIPVPFCKCKACKGLLPRRRAGYVIEVDKISLWLEASPDLREQFLEYKKVPEFLYISHIHYDHVVGLNELNQIWNISGLELNKLTLLLPKHLYKSLYAAMPFSHYIYESFYFSFSNLFNNDRIRLIIMDKKEFYYLTREVKIMQIENVHNGLLSSSLLVDYRNKRILYLADAEKLDDDIYRMLNERPADLTIVHAPFVINNYREGHLGLDDLSKLNTDQIVVTHFSHKINMNEKALERFIKKVEKSIGKDIILGYDGLSIKI